MVFKTRKRKEENLCNRKHSSKGRKKKTGKQNIKKPTSLFLGIFKAIIY